MEGTWQDLHPGVITVLLFNKKKCNEDSFNIYRKSFQYQLVSSGLHFLSRLRFLSHMTFFVVVFLLTWRKKKRHWCENDSLQLPIHKQKQELTWFVGDP